MKAAWKLLALTLRRMWVGCVLVILMYLGGLALMIGLRAPPMIVAVATAGWLWHMMAGITLRDLLRPETLLLPDFRRHLALAAGIDVLFTIMLPVVLMLMLGDARHALLAGTGMLLALAFGIATGSGLRVTLVFWLVFVIAGWQPALSGLIVHAALASAWTPLLLALAAILLLHLALRPLFLVADRAFDEASAGCAGRRPQAAARRGRCTPSTRLAVSPVEPAV